MRLRALFLASTALAVAISCQKDPEPEVKQEIKVSPESQAVFSSGITFESGNNTSGGSGSGSSTPTPQTTTVKFTASENWSSTVTDTKASSWLSLQPSSGGAGSVTITVTAQPNTSPEPREAKATIVCGSARQSFTVKQEGKPVAVTSINLNKTELTLDPGSSETLTATVEPDNATDKTVTWSTSNAGVATVTGGRVTAIKEGEAIITAKAGEKTATCKVTVNSGFIPVESVTLDKMSITLEEDQGAILTATVLPENATDKTVTWSTSNDQVATVSEGRVTSIKEGEAEITATAGDKSASCRVIVKKAVVPVTSITLNKEILNLIKGAEEVLVATVMPENASNKTVTWSSEDTSVASVDQTGKVKGLKGGSTVIIVKAGEKQATCRVEVTVPVESVSLDVTSMTLEPGTKTSILVIISPEDATNKKVTWTNTNPSVATVDENDNISALSVGTTVITATVENKSASCTITVKEAVVAVTSVRLNKDRLTLNKGESESLVATVKPDNATDKTVTWSSSDETVASVSQNGRVTALKSGTATITAKAGEKSATCAVTIKTPVESISLDRTSVSLEEGQTTTLVATISPNDADNQTIVWSTSKSTVARVSDGVVTAVSEGSATITAKVGGKSATCVVSVKKAVVAVTSVTLNKTTLSMTKGQTETLRATVLPNNATDKTVTWSSSDATVASVTQNGVVTAQKSGSAVITAKAGEQSATCEVTITTPVERISLDRTSLSMEEGQTTTVVATISPNDADDKTVEWTTSNASVATVANGVITAVAEGNATITAKAGGKSATCAVSVKKAVVAVTSVTLNKTNLSLTKGQSETLTATVNPSNATDKTVTWSSSDETVASVTQNGRVTALKSGSVSITAKAGEKSASCEVKITTPVESVSLDRATVSLEEGQSTTLVATISPNDADEKTVEWTTSNASVATVANGLVTAVAEGNATITAKVGGKSATCAVSVKKAVVAVTSVTLNKTALSLKKGQSETLTATVNPSNATDKTVTWSSSDETVATVAQNGHVTALKSGKATITAKAGEKSASCEVTITTPVESVSLDRTSVSLEEGQTTTLVATISPNDADEQTVEWTTSNAGIATVVNGVITAVAEGNATITAKAGGKSATCAISVKKAVVPVTSVTLSKTTLSLTKGQTETLTAAVNPSNATDKTVTWSSSDETIASVTQNGLVKAQKNGKATITAKAGEKSATCEVTITTPVESVSLDRTSVSLEEGQSTTLIATISPNDADEKTVEWTTSSTRIATVVNGVVTAVAEGSATITAKAGGKSATCTVSVKKAIVEVTSVTLDNSTLSLIKGESKTLTATVNPSNATDKTVTWSSSDETVAGITQNGQVTALKSGRATITAKAGEKSATCVVTITTPVEKISLDRTSMSLEEGQSTTLVATISPNDADEQTVEWTTSSAGIATVSDGVVTAVAEGSATITAKAGGKSATCVVTVKKAVVAVTSVTLNKASLSLIKGQGETLTATVNPSNATDKTVTWTSSDETIASVTQGGRVTAVKSGKATITAKAGEKSATCEVTITTPVESVSLDRTSVSLEEGQTTTLVATISPNDADEKTVEWTTSDASVATVANGVITAVAEGSATITAKAGGKTATCAVTVKKAVVPVTSIALNKSETTIAVGSSETLVATVLPANATDKTVTWRSLNTSIATVDQNGRVTAVSSGGVQIEAKAGECYAYCWVNTYVPISGITISPSSLTLNRGDNTYLSVTISPSDAYIEGSIQWQSSKPEVASVDQSGCIRALSAGTSTITASIEGFTASCQVTVKVPIESISLNKEEARIAIGSSETLVATVLPSDATDKTVTWRSLDTSIATVDQNGKVTAISNGWAQIEAKAGDQYAYCIVFGYVPISGITISPSSLTLNRGNDGYLSVTISPSDAYIEGSIQWQSSKPEVASVDQSGCIRALSAGTSTITASIEGFTASCVVTVSVPVTSITLNKQDTRIAVGSSETLVATVLPSDATDKTVTWRSLNTSIATVDQNGRVTAVSSGGAQVEAKAGDCYAYCWVNTYVPVSGITISEKSISINKDEGYYLSATIFPGDAYTESTVQWQSSKPEVASVDQNGFVRALTAGTATITASIEGFTASCQVTVKVPVTSVTLDKTNTILEVEQSITLVATVNPSDATDKTVTWESSNSQVATVDSNGKVVAKSVGWVTIYARSGNVFGTCVIEVKEKGLGGDDPEGFVNGGEIEW